MGVTVGESFTNQPKEFTHEDLPEEIRRKANRYMRRPHWRNRIVSLGEYWYVLDKGYSIDLIYVPPGGVSRDQATRLAHVSTFYSTLPWPDQTNKMAKRFIPKEILHRWYQT
jgi:hypothetical protein